MLSHTELAGVMDVAKSTDCSGPALPCSGSGADDNGHGELGRRRQARTQQGCAGCKGALARCAPVK